MFWVKDKDGDLINMMLVAFIRTMPRMEGSDKWEVRAFFSHYSADFIVMAKGTREECGRYRDMLFEKLRTHQSNLEVLD